MDFEARKRGLDNSTTPRDITIPPTENHTKPRKLRNNDRIPKYLPENIPIAHKTGELSGVRHDIGIVYTEKHPFIISAMTKT